jgi:3-oxoacyl-[acyl-carrier protein] reductase
MMKLRDRCAIVTGGNQGLGRAIAAAFVAEGASVLLCARDAALLELTRAELAQGLNVGQQVLVHTADVGVTVEVDAVVAAALRAFGRIDILVNNAGIYGPMGELEAVDWEQWVDALRINVLGTVYPCRAVIPAMKRQGGGKIINLSGGGATNPMPRLTAYATSKAAVVRFTESLALELAASRIDVNAIAPGALATRMLDQAIAAGPDQVGADFHARMVEIRDRGGTPLGTGSAACVYLASAASDGITGRLISAVWDRWASLQNHREALEGSDIYTLRRIVPEDRGQNWES